MKIDSRTKYVLENMVESWGCHECPTIWIHFKDGSNIGFYRLTENPNILCPKCLEIDFTIEQNTIMTAEGWTNDS